MLCNSISYNATKYAYCRMGMLLWHMLWS